MSTLFPWILSQADIPFEGIINVGVVGVILVLILVGVLVPGTTYKETAARAERLEKENKALHDSIKEDVIPLVVAAQTQAASVTTAGEKIVHTSEKLIAELERLRSSRPGGPS